MAVVIFVVSFVYLIIVNERRCKGCYTSFFPFLSQNSVRLPTSGQMVLTSVRLDSVDGGAVGGEGEVSGGR